MRYSPEVNFWAVLSPITASRWEVFYKCENVALRMFSKSSLLFGYLHSSIQAVNAFVLFIILYCLMKSFQGIILEWSHFRRMTWNPVNLNGYKCKYLWISRKLISYCYNMTIFWSYLSMRFISSHLTFKLLIE